MNTVYQQDAIETCSLQLATRAQRSRGTEQALDQSYAWRSSRFQGVSGWGRKEGSRPCYWATLEGRRAAAGQVDASRWFIFTRFLPLGSKHCFPSSFIFGSVALWSLLAPYLNYIGPTILSDKQSPGHTNNIWSTATIQRSVVLCQSFILLIFQPAAPFLSFAGNARVVTS